MKVVKMRLNSLDRDNTIASETDTGICAWVHCIIIEITHNYCPYENFYSGVWPACKGGGMIIPEEPLITDTLINDHLQ
jgi:hypothetical protein